MTMERPIEVEEDTAGQAKSETQSRPRRPRVQLDFTPEAYNRLLELVTMSRAESVPDMFREALRLFEWYHVRKSQGFQILVQKPGGKPMAVDLGI